MVEIVEMSSRLNFSLGPACDWFSSSLIQIFLFPLVPSNIKDSGIIAVFPCLNKANRVFCFHCKLLINTTCQYKLAMIESFKQGILVNIIKRLTVSVSPPNCVYLDTVVGKITGSCWNGKG